MGVGMPKRDMSNKEMLNEIKRLQAIALKHSYESLQVQTTVSHLLWEGQLGIQSLYFEYQCGLWQIQELKSAGEFCMTLAIGVLAIGMAVLFWPIYAFSGAIFALSYYYLFLVSRETKELETDMEVKIRKITTSIDSIGAKSSAPT
jgi:hypothetical protein